MKSKNEKTESKKEENNNSDAVIIKASDVINEDFTEEDLKKLNELQARQKRVSRTQEKINQLINEKHLSDTWFKICEIYEAKTEEEKELLFNHITSEKQKIYFKNYGPKPEKSFSKVEDNSKENEQQTFLFDGNN